MVTLLLLVLPYAVSYIKPVFVHARTPIIALPWLAVLLAAIVARLGTPLLVTALSLVFATAGVQLHR